MFEEFKHWLNATKPKSEKHYTSGYNTLNRISSSNGLKDLEEWTLDK